MLNTLRDELAGRSPAEPSPLHGTEAFRRLTAAIVGLRYSPGQMLSEREIMADLEVPRSALREAVVHLSDLGLIESLPRRGLLVSPIGALDVPRIYDARITIEGQLARFAALRARSEHIAALRANLHQEIPPDEGPAEERARHFVEHDHGVHLAMAGAAGNDLLEDALTRILPFNQRLWYWVYARIGPNTQVMFTHDKIVDSIANGDPDAAQAAITEHLQQARQALTEVFTYQISGGQR